MSGEFIKSLFRPYNYIDKSEIKTLNGNTKNATISRTYMTSKTSSNKG